MIDQMRNLERMSEDAAKRLVLLDEADALLRRLAGRVIVMAGADSVGGLAMSEDGERIEIYHKNKLVGEMPAGPWGRPS